jgi:hypothetical protein
MVDSRFHATSALPTNPACDARLNRSTGAWRPRDTDAAPALTVDLGATVSVHALAVQGDGKQSFVSAFEVDGSVDGVAWTAMKDDDGAPRQFVTAFAGDTEGFAFEVSG